MPDPAGLWESGRAARPLLISHRGFALAKTENTDAAFTAAAAIGADGFETDIRVTADGIPICHRDETLIRLAGMPGRVRDSRFGDIKQAFPPICRLMEALRHAARMAIVLDIKADTAWEVEHIAEALASSPHSHSVLAGTRTIGLSRLMARLMPAMPQFGFGLDAADLEEFRANGGTWVRIAEPELTDAAARHARGLGFRILVGIGEDYPGNIGPVTAGKIAHVMTTRPDAVMLDDPRLFLGLHGARRTERA